MLGSGELSSAVKSQSLCVSNSSSISNTPSMLVCIRASVQTSSLMGKRKQQQQQQQQHQQAAPSPPPSRFVWPPLGANLLRGGGRVSKGSSSSNNSFTEHLPPRALAVEELDEGLFIVDNVLTAQECRALIAAAEPLLEPTNPHNRPPPRGYAFRNNDRCGGVGVKETCLAWLLSAVVFVVAIVVAAVVVALALCCLLTATDMLLACVAKAAC